MNDSKPERVIAKVKQALAGIDRPTISCLGPAFKAYVDDLRDSPAMNICLAFAEIEDANIAAVEPQITERPKQLREYSDDSLAVTEASISAADFVVPRVYHQRFRDILTLFDLPNVKVINTRGQWG